MCSDLSDVKTGLDMDVQNVSFGPNVDFPFDRKHLIEAQKSDSTLTSCFTTVRDKTVLHVHVVAYFKSNQIKSLLLSHHHSTSGLVSEILMSVLQTVQKKKQQQQLTYGQTVQKNNKQFTYGQTVQKNNKQFTYGQTVQKNNKQFTYGQTVQKSCTGAFTVLQTVQKKQQQFTYGQYIFTDCTEDNVQNTHTYTQYT